MVARKRNHRETQSQYRYNLKKEENALKRKLAGVILWPARRGTARRVMIKGAQTLTNGTETVLIG